MLNLSLGGDPSGEGSNSTTSNQSSKNKQKEMRSNWLSQLPPGSHSCVLCNKSFDFLEELEVHQNSHRILQLKAVIRNLHLKKIKEEKKKMKKNPRGKTRDNNPSRKDGLQNQLVVSNDNQSGIDLDLHLGVGCSKKVVEFYEFIPVKRMKF